MVPQKVQLLQGENVIQVYLAVHTSLLNIMTRFELQIYGSFSRCLVEVHIQLR